MLRSLCILLLLLVAPPARAGEPVLIGLDAEFGNKTSTSAQAIEQGLQIAINEINQSGGVLGGRPLKLVTRDNKSVTAIAVDNLRALAAMRDMVAVFGGRFSPVYVECLPVAQELGIPLLSPWGSADPITDHDFKPSYTFRLSLKDAWAAPAFIRFAKQQYKANRLGVLLPNTAWGRSNARALSIAAAEQGALIVGERWYNWGDATLIDQYQTLRTVGAEAIILVANEGEAATLVRDVAALDKTSRLPIISHWGITGGRFFELSGEALQQVDFSVIQTFSFIDLNTPTARRVMGAMQRDYGATSAESIRSPVGVAHAYDLMHLLAKAIGKAGSTDRRKIRDALEQLGPYDGLVRRYAKPFTVERHDALSPAQIFFARFTPEGVLLPLERRGR